MDGAYRVGGGIFRVTPTLGGPAIYARAVVTYLVFAGFVCVLAWAFPRFAIGLGLAVMVFAILSRWPVDVAVWFVMAGALLAFTAAVFAYRRRNRERAVWGRFLKRPPSLKP